MPTCTQPCLAACVRLHQCQASCHPDTTCPACLISCTVANNNCLAQSPHNIVLACSQISAKNFPPCEVVVDIQHMTCDNPEPHRVNGRCRELTAMRMGILPPSPCAALVQGTRDVCGHSFSETCSQVATLASRPCKVTVIVPHRGCTNNPPHTLSLACSLASSAAFPSKCVSPVRVRRPFCNHDSPLECHLLAEWLQLPALTR